MTPPPPDPAEATRALRLWDLAVKARAVVDAVNARDAAIAAAVAGGIALRPVADAAGLAPETVRKIAAGLAA